MPSELPDDVAVRVATPDDELGVRRVLDAAMLDVEELPERLAAGEVLVATARERVCGAVVVAPEGAGDAGAGAETGHAAPGGLPTAWATAAHVRAIAVRRRRRDDGIGSALLRAAAERFGPLVADFDADLVPFYESVGAEVRAVGDGERRWARVPEPE